MYCIREPWQKIHRCMRHQLGMRDTHLHSVELGAAKIFCKCNLSFRHRQRRTHALRMLGSLWWLVQASCSLSGVVGVRELKLPWLRRRTIGAFYRSWDISTAGNVFVISSDDAVLSSSLRLNDESFSYGLNLRRRCRSCSWIRECRPLGYLD